MAWGDAVRRCNASQSLEIPAEDSAGRQSRCDFREPTPDFCRPASGCRLVWLRGSSQTWDVETFRVDVSLMLVGASSVQDEESD